MIGRSVNQNKLPQPIGSRINPGIGNGFGTSLPVDVGQQHPESAKPKCPTSTGNDAVFIFRRNDFFLSIEK
jgi:hypothetical protein